MKLRWSSSQADFFSVRQILIFLQTLHALIVLVLASAGGNFDHFTDCANAQLLLINEIKNKALSSPLYERCLFFYGYLPFYTFVLLFCLTYLNWLFWWLQVHIFTKVGYIGQRVFILVYFHVNNSN